MGAALVDSAALRGWTAGLDRFSFSAFASPVDENEEVAFLALLPTSVAVVVAFVLTAARFVFFFSSSACLDCWSRDVVGILLTASKREARLSCTAAAPFVPIFSFLAAALPAFTSFLCPPLFISSRVGK